MINRAAENSFLQALYEQKNIIPKISLKDFNKDPLLETNLEKELTKQINEFLALELLPLYTSILAYRKQIVPEYYYPKYENDYYEISKYRDFQHFSLTVFFDKETLINAHLFGSIYTFVKQFFSTSNSLIHQHLIYNITKYFSNYIGNLSIDQLFTLYELPSEQQKLKICQDRSKNFNKHLNERKELNKILDDILKDTKQFEKTLVFISNSNIYHLSTKQIKNALTTEKDSVSALEAHLKLNPLSLYDRNHYLSVIVIEPTHLKIQYNIVKIYRGFTLDKSNGFFSISPENLKKGLNVVKKHWVFRYFNL